MSDDTHATPLWVTFASLAWHSDPATGAGVEPKEDQLAAWHRLRGLDLPDRQRARRMLSRRTPGIRWPGETFAHAWRKLGGQGEVPATDRIPDIATERWDGGDATYYRMGGLVVIVHAGGGLGIACVSDGPPQAE